LDGTNSFDIVLGEVKTIGSPTLFIFVWANITNCVYIKAFGIYSSVHFIVLRQDLLKSFVASFYGKTNKTHSNGLQKFQYASDLLIEPSNQKLFSAYKMGLLVWKTKTALVMLSVGQLQSWPKRCAV